MIRDQRGFSYVEAALVIAIIGLLLVVSLPRLEAYQSLLNLRRAARGIAGDLRLAQQLAVSNDVNYRWVYSSGSPPKYTIEKVSDATVVRDVSFPEDVTLTTDPASYRPEFTPAGAPLTPGGICLTDVLGNAMTLSVKAGTGRIQIQDGLVDECAP